MSLFILDTDIVSLYQRNHSRVCEEIQKHPLTELAITVLTVEEQLSGWYTELRKAKDAPRLAAVYERMTMTIQFFGRFSLFTFTETAIERYQNLQQLKLGVGKMDLRIAAIALEQNGILVTRNTRDFERVPDLRIEDRSK